MSNFAKVKCFFSVLVAVSIMFAPLHLCAQEQTSVKSIAILPFEVHAGKDLYYLKNGIRDMLASRLAAGGGVNIIAKSSIDKVLKDESPLIPADFKKVSTRLKADYLVSGSFTSLGGGASLDAKVFNADSNETLDFFGTAPKEDDVIMAINTLAWDIGEKMLGRKRPTRTTPVAQIQAPTPTSSAPSSFHPEKALMGGSGMYGSAFIRPSAMTGPFGFTKSQNFHMAMQAMDVGDVDGDGVDDVVIASRRKLSVYRHIENRFVKIAEVPVGFRYNIHYVSLADLNKNGKAEIYVSTNEKSSPNAFAVEWKDGQLEYLFKDTKFYVRAMEIPAGGMVLAGQKGSIDDRSFQPGIYQLEQKEGRVRAGMKIMVPEKVNLFDFVMVDLDGNGRTEVVTIDQGDKMKVLRQSGKQIWKSADYYGGTKRFVGEAEMEMSAGQVERYYIPSRLVVADLNNDKKPDIVTNKNLSSSSRVFANLKSYPNGEIHGLSWNGIALTELWHTRKIDGYIADYQLRILPEPGKAILYVGVVLSTGLDEILSASESTVLMYPLDFGEEKGDK